MVSLLEGACSRECCILCFNVLAKGTDRNLVNGKNKIIDDLNDLPFVVHNLSDYICKKCLMLVKKRLDLKDRLKDRLSLDSIVSGEMRTNQRFHEAKALSRRR